MMGKVHGPYVDKRCTRHNYKHVQITLYNEDGSKQSKKSIPYTVYLKEKEQGLHEYEEPIGITPYERRVKYFNKVREEFNLPLITEDNKEQFYYPNTHEIERLPGYYYIPFVGSIYAISKEGIVIIIPENKKIKHKLSDGYKKYNLTWCKDNTAIHRLLALLFVSRPDRHLDKSYDELQVNHKDGIKTNNDLDNLEWVTHIENLDHAVINRLSKSKL